MQYIQVHRDLCDQDGDQGTNTQICLTKFPELFDSHWNGDPSTRSVEIYAKEFVKTDMPHDRLFGFMRMVFGWGGSPYVGNKFMKHNAKKLQDVHSAVLASHKYLNEKNDKAAIESLTALKGLDVSYASKHLKFLDPENAVVLDSIIVRELGYENSEDGYVEFVGKCREWKELLNEKRIACGRSREGTWRVSDVEMAVFKHVEKTFPKPKKKKT